MSRNRAEAIENEFDYVIIGAGLVGLYLCNLLSIRFPTKNICLVERGGVGVKFPEGVLKTKSRSHSATSDGRLFGLGGTSRIWGGQLSEFDPEDFTEWPIGYEEMKRWYDEVYSVLDCHPPGNCRSISRELSFGRANLEFVYTSWLKNPDFSKVFSRLLVASNVKILLNHQAERFLFDSNGVCIGCEVYSSSEHHKLLGGHTIISAGVFESIKLVSSIDCLQFPQSCQSEVGLFFQDHIGCVISNVKMTDRGRFQEIFENRFLSGTKIQPKLKARYKIGKKNSISISGFFSNVSAFDEYIFNLKALCRSFTLSDIKILSFRTILGSLRILPIVLRMIIKLILQKRIHSFFGDVRFHIQCEQVPVRSSRVIVDGDQVYLDWRFGGKEIAAISRFQDDVDEFLIENRLGSFETENRFTNLSDLSFHDTAHASGGLRMTDVDEIGVVNPDLTIKGLRNLSCVSSAVFPTSGQANVTLSILALCHKFVEQQEKKAVIQDREYS